MEYIRAIQLYHIRQSIKNAMDQAVESISQSNETALVTRLTKENSGRNWGIYLKARREERTYVKLLKVSAKHINETEKEVPNWKACREPVIIRTTCAQQVIMKTR